MYKIIGADGKEYGPISADVVRQWLAEGRADAQTRVLPEGGTEWQPLSAFPEFGAAASGSPPPLPAGLPAGPAARSQVTAPAVALMISAILGILYQAAMMLFRVLGTPFLLAQQNAQMPAWIAALSGTVGTIMGVVGILIGLVILFGAIKMKRLEGYTLAVTSCILAMVPCLSPCCLLGLPFGIWALVVLCKPEVKAAFH